MKNNLTYCFITLLSLLCFTNASHAQEQPVYEKLRATLTKYRYSYPQEKVYLHLDKPYYMAGETMWLKGYLFDASSNGVDSVSRVLYVDLVQPATGKVIVHKVLKALAVSVGDIQLPDTLANDLYRIRAYTNYMRNFSESLFFEKDVRVWQNTNMSSMNENKAQALNEVASISFFPEGGYLVENLESRLAFKVVNKLGKGVETSGFVLANDKDTVGVFSTAHLGHGVFNFHPEANNTYSAYVRKSDGSYIKQELPQPQKSGYIMSVDNVTYKDKIRLYIQNSSPKPAGQGKELPIIVQQRGEVCMIAKGSESSKSFVANIPKNQIPDDGVVQITLFSPEGLPICERLIFVEHGNRTLQVNVSSNKTEYKSREKVDLNIEVKDAEGKPVQGTFSVAVTDASQVKGEPYADNILTYVLLNSEVKESLSGQYYQQIQGSVEQPQYYFDNTQENRHLHLDLLMMTQGWRRFTWQQMLNDVKPKMDYFVEQGLEITGKALRPNGKVTDKLTLTLMLKKPKENPIIAMTSVDSLGRYGFYNLDFTDSVDVYLQAVKANGARNLTLTIDEALSLPKTRPLQIPNEVRIFDPNAFATFLKYSRESIELEKKLITEKVQMLQEVTVTAKKEPTDSRKIYGQASNTLKVDDTLCGGMFSVLQMLQGRIPGVQVIQTGMGTYSVLIRGQGSINASNDPLFLIDGMQVSSDVINTLPPCDVESIDVLKGADASIFGVRGGNGVVSVLTRKGNANYDWSKSNIDGVKIQKRMGYAMTREFFAPQYGQAKPEHVRPDYRSTLYWNANITTDASGKATTSFWNSDAKGNMTIKLEGMSNQGRVGVAQNEYLVR